MSPEQAKGLPDVDTRTDVFAMGAILYEALTGKIAFEAPTVADILMKIVRHHPAPPTTVKLGLPPTLDAVIAKALSKDKKNRFQSPTELMDATFTAFGVEGGGSRWAHRPEAELDAAIVEASGKAVTLRPAAPVASPVAAHAPRAPLEKAHVQEPLPPPRSSRVAFIAGLAVAAFVVAGGVAAVVLYIIG